MLVIILTISILTLLGVALAPERSHVWLYGLFFMLVEVCCAVWALLNMGESFLGVFTLDALGVSYFVLMSVIGVLCLVRSIGYLDVESLRHVKIYVASFVMLNVALTGVYFSNNIAVGWIFLEATTLATAGLIYHRRTSRSLEATWKYIFVSSVGIAIAYLGILMLSTVAHGTSGVDLSYAGLAGVAPLGNVLYMKLAFLLILVGYSTKMEIFPFFTVGIDANHSAPTPSSAFISTAMVGGGFVSIFRVFRTISGNAEVLGWAQNLMILVGLLSIFVSLVYMGRTGNYKRFFAYSTVENSGIVMLGLGLSGLGVWAAVFHALSHTLVKGVVYLQLSVVGRMYRNYRVGHIGGYFRRDPLGAVVLLLAAMGLVAMPGSLLLRSEFLIFTQMVSQGYLWLLVVVGGMLLGVIYWILTRVLAILWGHSSLSTSELSSREGRASSGADAGVSWALLVVLVVFFVLGVWTDGPMARLVDMIVY